jgi:dTMP kinase
MPARGKFIVIEGIDGSGKRTQLDLLARALAQRGHDLSQVSFPNYNGFFGKLVARFLNGEFGPLDSVDPHSAALLYAGDRLESKPALESALAAGKILLSDRYIASNLAHQGSRVPAAKRDDFLAWLRRLEYDVNGLPAEDLVIYLHVPVADAHRLVASKNARDYTDKKHDIQEADLAHLEAASRVYDELARQPHWVRIDCFDAAQNALRSLESIHGELLSAIEARIAPALRAQG